MGPSLWYTTSLSWRTSALGCGMQDLVPQPGIEPQPPCTGSTESQQLDYQGHPSEDINGTLKCPLSQTGYYRLLRFGRLIRPMLQDGVSHTLASPGAGLSGRLVGGEWRQDRGLGAESTPEPGTPRQCCFCTFLCLKLWICSAMIPGIARRSCLREGPQLPCPFHPYSAGQLPFCLQIQVKTPVLLSQPAQCCETLNE